MAYTSLLKGRSILSLKLVTEVLFGIEIDPIARNRLRFNRMELWSTLQPLGELLPGGSRLIVLRSHPYYAVIHYLLSSSLPSINRV